MDKMLDGLRQASIFAVVGIVIGLGQLLAGQEKLTRRIIVGRALSTGGIAMGAGAAGVWFPNLSFGETLGLAALLASLGTSALESIFQRVLNKG